MIYDVPSNVKNFGLLLLRVGLGVMFVVHGYPKITGGVESWTQLGEAAAFVGLGFMPAFWGFMAALSEFGGGLCLILGFMTRPAGILMAFTMFVATMMHLGRGDGFNVASHAIEVGIVFLSLALIGPGRFSLDCKLFSKK